MNYTEACEWLGVDTQETLDEGSLKMAFRRAAIKEHPDKSNHSNATERFQNVKRAHEFLEKCLERGETGRNADLSRTDEDDGKYEYHHEDDDDILEEFLAHMVFTRMMFGGGPRGGPFGGGPRGGPSGFSFMFGGGGGMGGMYDIGEEYSDEDEYYDSEEEEEERRMWLKENEAPLLDEWVKIVNLKSSAHQHLNGQKARAVDYNENNRK